MLVINSCLAELIFGRDILAMALLTFHNDLKQSQYPDSLCVCRGFIGYVVTILQNYSYLLQALYCYLSDSSVLSINVVSSFSHLFHMDLSFYMYHTIYID